MAVVAVDFTHFELTCAAGDVLPDDHELVALAPHLFVQPDSEALEQASDPTPTIPAAKAKRNKEA
jgi:hypothetical protein